MAAALISIASNGRLAEGDRLRMSIEAARSGYLYVVDQEQYADGSIFLRFI
jgi:hypothetical protein